MKLGELLNALATKIGAHENAAFKELLASPELAKAELKPELAQVFESGLGGLLTADEAKKDAGLVKHFTKDILSREQERIKAHALTLEDEELTEAIGKAPLLYNQVEILGNSIKKYKAQLKEAGTGTKTKEAEAQLNELKAVIADLEGKQKQAQKAFNEQLETERGKYEGELTNYLLRGEISKRKFVDALSVDDATLLIDNKVQARVNALGAKIVRKDGKLALVKMQDGHEVDIKDERNAKVTLDTLIESVASPYLPKSAPPKQNEVQPINEQPIAGANQLAQDAINHNLQQLEHLRAASR